MSDALVRPVMVDDKRGQDEDMSETKRQAIRTTEAPTPVFAYSQAVASQGLLFVSGQVGIDPTTRQVAQDFDGQLRRALENVDAIARAAGASLADAVRVGVYLARGDDFQAMDAVYREYFGEPLPARTTVTVGLQGVAVEVDAVIALRETP